jgi:spermidine synthase
LLIIEQSQEEILSFSQPRSYIQSAIPSVVIVGGTDGSGTRRVVQLLTDLGAAIVSEDPETYDIHADLVGGWPPLVQPVLEVLTS